MQLTKLNIPLQIVIEDANLILINVAPYYNYVDGKKTDAVIGYRYTVVEDKNFDKINVKIPSTTPAISQETIDSAKQRILVSFENAFAKPYRTPSGNYDLSITASGINIANKQ